MARQLYLQREGVAHPGCHDREQACFIVFYNKLHYSHLWNCKRGISTNCRTQQRWLIPLEWVVGEWLCPGMYLWYILLDCDATLTAKEILVTDNSDSATTCFGESRWINSSHSLHQKVISTLKAYHVNPFSGRLSHMVASPDQGYLV